MRRTAADWPFRMSPARGGYRIFPGSRCQVSRPCPACFSSTASVPFAAMNKTVIEVQVRAVLPTSGGCAVFLGNTDKVFIIYVDQTVGSAITMFMRDISKERPLTHDLIAHLMTALGARVERVIINDLKNATYYARMISKRKLSSSMDDRAIASLWPLSRRPRSM